MFCKILFLISISHFDVFAADLGPVSNHFIQYLKRHHKKDDALLRHIESYDDTGSFGGKLFTDEKIVNTPVIFVHGNSDSALKFGDGEFQSGWDETLKYFISKDYTLAELYGITYGDRNITNSFTRKFNCDLLTIHRRFFEAVLHYTKSEKIDVVAHSMGVSVARKVIQGGEFVFDNEACNLGPSMSQRVRVFLAMCSANYGMCACETIFQVPACGKETGFYPGHCAEHICQSPNMNTYNNCSNISYSKFLSKLNKNGHKDAEFVASFWSDDDEIIGKGNLVWGRQTSLVPHSDLKKIYKGMKHMQVKLLTVADQFKILNEEQFLLEQEI